MTFKFVTFAASKTVAPKSSKFPSYCIKAEAKIFNNKNEQIGTCIGYDENYSIVERVTTTCKVNIRRRQMYCGETMVTLIGYPEFNCTGIVQYQIDDNISNE